MKKIFALLLLAVLFTVNAFADCCHSACCQKKSLVLYYSQGGATRQVAELIQRTINADIEEIMPVEPYAADYDTALARCRQERETGVIPQVLPLKSNLNEYGTIFIGYPIWFGTYALPIYGLLENEKFEGKRIVPFCTFGSGGLENSIADLRKALTEATIEDGYGVRNARLAAAPEEINRFLIENGFIKGEVNALPEYSEQQPVTDAEKEIFNAACSSYKFPLGTPVSCGKRAGENSTDYKFIANAKTPDGETSNFSIYITVPKGSDSVPEFTRIVR